MTKTGRRALLFGGVALVASGAGAGWAWRRNHGQEAQAQASAGSLWTQRFARPDGSELAMSSLRGRPLVLNFWATWCAPCLKELPQIDRFHREFQPKGWQVLGLALDKAAPVREFLAKLPLSFPVALGGLDGTDVAIELGNLQGALPFTVIFDAQGTPRWHKLGETGYAELAAQAQKL